MASIQDDRGYNQGFKPCKALTVRFERRCDRMIREMTITPNTRILELGCGIGELSFFLAQKTGAQVVGTDLCQEFIEKARAAYQLPNLSFKQLKLEANTDSATPSETYDYIVGNGILHHVYDGLETILAHLKSQLRPGGKVLFWEPNLFNPYIFLIFKFEKMRRIAKLEPDEMAFGRSFITQKLRNSGFSTWKVEYSDFLLPNTPDALIQPMIHLGDFLERVPLVDRMAQSLFISAENQSHEPHPNR